MTVPALHSRIASSVVRFLLGIAVACMTGSVAQANPGTTFTELWAIQGKPGKGHLTTHQEPVIFLTSFTYRADRTPYWLSATLFRGPDAAGAFVYSGDLYETSGSPFDAQVDQTVGYRMVGWATFASNGLTATLQYTKDGTTIAEQLTRFTLHNLDFSGVYISGVTYQTRNCSSPMLNGRRFVEYGLTTVTQPAGQLNIVVQGENTTCTFGGNYAQTGSLGNVSGAMSCTDGTSGSLQIGALQQTFVGWTALFRAQTAACELDGSFAATLY